MGKYDTVEELFEAVDANGGVLTVQMVDIRDACKYERLRTHVVADISRKLDRAGLGHYPTKLPEDQERHVRLYKTETPFGEWFQAALRPTRANDAKLKGLLDLFNNGATAKVIRARALAEKLVEALDA